MPRKLVAHKAALYGCALQHSMTDVVIYTTSMATTSKIKKDTYRIKQLLDTKKVPYTEVPQRRECCPTVLLRKAL